MANRIEFISSEPKLAKVLRGRRPILLSRDMYEWVVGWVEDVGTLMRSREYKVSIVAYYTGYLILFNLVRLPLVSGILESLPGLRRALGV